MTDAVAVAPERHVEREERVTPLELFFDLVFVFAITQVTALLSAQATWPNVARGLLVLGALWWAWAAYAWLTNTIDPEEGGVRLAMFAAMASMLVVALAVPGAFDDDALLFGVAYFVVRMLHIVLYAQGSPDLDVRGAVMRLLPTSVIGPGLIIAASLFDGVAQGAVWAVALAIDFGGPLVAGMAGWRLAPGHFAERHGLIVIVALGESIVALGVGAAGLPLDAGVVAAAVAGIAIAAALWWAYFDVVALVAARKLAEASGVAQAAMARDSYSYLHLPMIAGIVLLALGIKKALAHVEDPLETVPAVALCGGVALYLLAHIAFRLRNVRSLNRPRLLTAAVLLALIPLATSVPALAALSAVAVLCAALIGYEAIAYREARARVRAARA